jgi:5-methylcytosine-specific restriction protein A
VRDPFIAAHRTCIDCGAPSTDADHAPTSRRDLLAQGVDDPDDWQYLQPRCHPCHSRKTAAVDGGWGHAKPTA